MVETGPAVLPHEFATDVAWLGAPYAAVHADATGVVRAANEAAKLLFPHAAPDLPLTVWAGWLGRAHQAPEGVARGLLGDRSFEAHPVDHGDGAVTWWLVEDTDARLARNSLRLER
ncbi:serine/threonine protein phosphatase, partial [Actinosynnema sp. NPDC023658]